MLDPHDSLRYAEINQLARAAQGKTARYFRDQPTAISQAWGHFPVGTAVDVFSDRRGIWIRAVVRAHTDCELVEARSAASPAEMRKALGLLL